MLWPWTWIFGGGLGPYNTVFSRWYSQDLFILVLIKVMNSLATGCYFSYHYTRLHKESWTEREATFQTGCGHIATKIRYILSPLESCTDKIHGQWPWTTMVDHVLLKWHHGYWPWSLTVSDHGPGLWSQTVMPFKKYSQHPSTTMVEHGSSWMTMVIHGWP